MQTADRAWIGLAAGVILYDAACPRGQLLSQASARYSQRHRILWPATVIYVAGHLCHYWPERYDPLSRLATALGR